MLAQPNVEAVPKFPAHPFGLGVASGDPYPQGVALWTRIAPKPLEPDAGVSPDRKIPVRWEVAEDEGFTKVVRRGTEVAVPESAYAVHVDLDGLEPGRWYSYRFRVGGETSPVGRTKTAPAPAASPDGLRFAFASCQEFEHGYYTAYHHMAREDLDLVIHLGDYIYEYGTDVYKAPSGNVRHHIGDETNTLEEYRQRYAQYKSDEQLQAAHAAFPWLVTTDDHEVENNYADEYPEKLREENKSIPAFLDRRAAAYQAYWEHMPQRKSRMPQGGVAAGSLREPAWGARPHRGFVRGGKRPQRRPPRLTLRAGVDGDREQALTDDGDADVPGFGQRLWWSSTGSC